MSTGLDEHGSKVPPIRFLHLIDSFLQVYTTAEKSGKDVVEFIEERKNEFESLWQGLDIEIDTFVRTSSDDHRGSFSHPFKFVSIGKRECWKCGIDLFNREIFI